jgi:type II secretory pathway predicted ATPase ExeA
MFLEFYHLRQQPFGVTPDPAYLYLTRTHRDALTALLAGIKEGRGFFALIAEPGMGKTTLLYELLDELHDAARTVFLFQTQCDSREFFQYLLSELGVDTKSMDLVSMHNKLNEVLFAEMVAGRRFVLVVDESQNLDDSVLETVRLLSNFETSYAKMLQIVLAGQPQLSDKLGRPQLAQLRQRLAVIAELEPLSAAETANYIEHRLKVAGYSGASLFTTDALALVARLSHGTPRTINHLCYSALSAGHAQGREVIGADIVQAAAAKLGLTAGSGDLIPALREQKTSAQTPLPSPVIEPAVPAGIVQESTKEGSSGGAVALTYQPGTPFRMPRWAFRALVLGGILLLAGISLTAFVLRLTEPDQEKAARPAVPGQLLPGSEKAPVLPSVPVSSQSTTNSRSSVVPGSVRPEPTPNYSADPQENGSLQVITVAIMPHQTLRDISLLYIGKFDDDLFKQIIALNPELKDPNRPEPGQLIRLPLPPGSFRKGKVFTPEE